MENLKSLYLSKDYEIIIEGDGDERFYGNEIIEKEKEFLENEIEDIEDLKTNIDFEFNGNIPNIKDLFDFVDYIYKLNNYLTLDSQSYFTITIIHKPSNKIIFTNK